ncbi:ATP-binding protein [Chloroflexota bacterium]
MESGFSKPLSTQYIGGYTLLKDIYGKPALILRLVTPRYTYQLGQLTTSYYILLILGLGILVGGVTMFMVHKQILSRFTTLIRGINHIANTGDTSARISLKGRDELNLVAGTVNGMLAVLQDSEDELKKRESRYRLLADNVTDIIFTIDINLRFTYISPSVTALSGYSIEEAMTLSLSDILTSDSLEIAMQAFMQEMAKEKMEQKELSRSRTLELEMRRKDGFTTWAEVSMTFIRDSDDQSIGVMGIARDISERRQAAEELQLQYKHERALRQQLEEEIQKRVEFTRALIHELRTPITPVLAAAELLLDEIKDEHSLRLVQSIDRSASNLNRRIDELIDLIKGETDMLQIEPTPVDVVSLLRDISHEVMPVALHGGYSMTVDLPSSNPIVSADKDRLQQVVMNLLNNAFKFTPTGGEITLSAREEGVNIIVEVQDNGPGISEEEQNRLFIPYHRRVEDRDRLGGLGLGLAISKRLVELHRGNMWVKSEKGKGSTFGFSLPLEIAIREERGNNSGGES